MRPDPSSITPDLLSRAGRALYGERWKLALARELGISERMIRFMLAGERGIRADYAERLVDILRARQADIDIVIRAIARQPVEHV